MTSRPRALAAILATSVALAGTLVLAPPAQAGSAYRFWTYWYANPTESAWTYGPIGPAGHVVDDGSVEGWRFVVAAPNPQAPQPRVSATSAFASICGKTAKPDGKDRVAVVVDFGTAADAPRGESPPAGVRGTCAVVPHGSRGLAALDAAGYRPRLEGGLVCGLSGYPARECGVVVKQPTPTPSPTKAKPTKPAAPSTSPTRAGSPPASRDQPSKDKGGTASPRATDSPPGPASSSSPALTPSSSDRAPAPDVSPESSGAALAVGPAPPPAGGSSTGTPVGLLLGGALVLLIAAAALFRTRGAASQDAA